MWRDAVAQAVRHQLTESSEKRRSSLDRIRLQIQRVSHRSRVLLIGILVSQGLLFTSLTTILLPSPTYAPNSLWYITSLPVTYWLALAFLLAAAGALSHMRPSLRHVEWMETAVLWLVATAVSAPQVVVYPSARFMDTLIFGKSAQLAWNLGSTSAPIFNGAIYPTEFPGSVYFYDSLAALLGMTNDTMARLFPLLFAVLFATLAYAGARAVSPRFALVGGLAATLFPIQGTMAPQTYALLAFVLLLLAAILLLVRAQKIALSTTLILALGAITISHPTTAAILVSCALSLVVLFSVARLRGGTALATGWTVFARVSILQVVFFFAFILVSAGLVLQNAARLLRTIANRVLQGEFFLFGDWTASRPLPSYSLAIFFVLVTIGLVILLSIGTWILALWRESKNIARYTGGCLAISMIPLFAIFFVGRDPTFIDRPAAFMMVALPFGLPLYFVVRPHLRIWKILAVGLLVFLVVASPVLTTYSDPYNRFSESELASTNFIERHLPPPMIPVYLSYNSPLVATTHIHNYYEMKSQNGTQYDNRFAALLLPLIYDSGEARVYGA